MSLLVLSRCQDIALRKEYVELVENVKDSGGDVKIFSSLHVSGERKFDIETIFTKCTHIHMRYKISNKFFCVKYIFIAF